MALYGKVDAGRKILSQVLAAKDDLHGRTAVEFQTTAIKVKAADEVIEPMGIPVVHTASGWKVFDNAETFVDSGTPEAPVPATVTASDLLGGAKVAIIVGDNRGVGYNFEDVKLVAAGTDVTALYRGDAAILKSGIDFSSVTGGDATTLIASFDAELSKQSIMYVGEAAPVTVTY